MFKWKQNSPLHINIVLYIILKLSRLWRNNDFPYSKTTAFILSPVSLNPNETIIKLPSFMPPNQYKMVVIGKR